MWQSRKFTNQTCWVWLSPTVVVFTLLRSGSSRGSHKSYVRSQLSLKPLLGFLWSGTLLQCLLLLVRSWSRMLDIVPKAARCPEDFFPGWKIWSRRYIDSSFFLLRCLLGSDWLSLYRYYRRLCCQGQLTNAKRLLTNTERNLTNAKPNGQSGW